MRILSVLVRGLLGLRYRVEIEGLEALEQERKGGLIFLPNHPALVDPVILVSHLHARFAPRILADRDQIQLPVLGWVIRKVGAIAMPDPGKYGEAALPEVEEAFADCEKVLASGGNLLLYPAGRLMRSRFEDLGGASGVQTLLARVPGARVVQVRTLGLWGSRFSRATGKAPELLKGLGRGVLELLVNGLCFMPRRTVRIRFQVAEALPTERLALNRTLEAFYNAETLPRQSVARFWWQDARPRELPEPELQQGAERAEDIPQDLRDKVLTHLRELSGRGDLQDDLSLARDLGLDSLGRLELQAWVEQECQVPPSNPEALQTVADVLLAAAGKGQTETTALAMDPRWFSEALPLEIPAGDNVLEVILAQARRDPDRPALWDDSGLRTYRDLVTALLVLKPRLAALEGTHLGLMFPASAGAAVLYLAALAAGKTPVMLNWTTGQRNFDHALAVLDIRKVLTAKALMTRLEGQGHGFGTARERFVFAEELGAQIGLGSKLGAAVKASLGLWSALSCRPGTAVVLFTSGSENLPKAVPLTHANLLSNLRDIASLFPEERACRMMGFLPPFHSFGLTCTTLLPLAAGFPVAYHPNPTEGGRIAAKVAASRATLLAGTPTFLAGIARAASDAQLASLKWAIVGAEKCPEALFESLAKRWPGMEVLEGYGITECSPVVSVNRPGQGKRGSIGLPLPSVKTLRLDPETGEAASPERPGMLFVRGPSIFGGYLHHDGESPFEVHGGEAWYRTGDLVRVEADGSLVFAGRLKRFVKLAGEMVSLPAIEEALLAAFGQPEDSEVPLAVEATATEPPELVLFSIRPLDRETANAALRAAGLGALCHLKRVITLEHIPVLGTGKTDYRALKGLLG